MPPPEAPPIDLLDFTQRQRRNRPATDRKASGSPVHRNRYVPSRAGTLPTSRRADLHLPGHLLGGGDQGHLTAIRRCRMGRISG